MRIEIDAYPVWEREGPPRAIETAAETIRKILAEDALAGPVQPVIPRRAGRAERPQPAPRRLGPAGALARTAWLWLLRPFRKGSDGGPAWGRIGLALIGLALLVDPLPVGSVILLVLAGPVIAGATLGPDRSAGILRAIHARIDRRDPARAAALRRRARALSRRLERLARRLPGDWADRLALVGAPPHPVAATLAGDPFDRLRPTQAAARPQCRSMAAG